MLKYGALGDVGVGGVEKKSCKLRSSFADCQGMVVCGSEEVIP